MALLSEMQKRVLVLSANFGTMDNGVHWGSATVFTPSKSSQPERSGAIGSLVTALQSGKLEYLESYQALIKAW